MAMFAVYSVDIFTFLCISLVSAVSVQIDGVIDLGPKWNNEYKLELVSPIPLTPKASTMRALEHETKSITKGRKKNTKSHLRMKQDDLPTKEIPEVRVTKYKDHFKPKRLFEKPHAVKDDTKINDFTYHVYKQSLKVFDEIRQKINPSIVDRVDVLAKNYDERFRAFVNETSSQKIKTRLGSQRVILNTIETSNRLLRKLVNYFIGDLKKEGILRSNEVAINVFQKEVEREVNLELLHVCSKFGICRSSAGFSDFLINYLTIILKTDDSKVKKAADALTEVVKNTDFSRVMETNTVNKFQHKVNVAERWDGATFRAMFWITRNAIAMKNLPIKVMTFGNEHVAKTVAFLEVIDQLDKIIPANEENKLEWTDLENSLSDWAAGKRDDILEVMQGLISHLKKKAINSFDTTTLRNMNDKLNIFFS